MTESLKNKSGNVEVAASTARTYNASGTKEFIKVNSNEVTANDRPDLEGKIVPYFFGNKGDNKEPAHSAVVIGCNRHVGVTIVDANDKDKFLVCIPGPILPDFDKKLTELWDNFYDVVVESLESGTICHCFM